jgi:hypothetical protein
MKPYAYLTVPQEDLDLFDKIDKVIQEMPDIDLGENKKREKTILSCHMIARALARLFPVEFKDGYFGGFNTHSWLITRNGLIIDSYPVATIGGPILIDKRFITAWNSLYREAPLPGLNNISFLKNVDKVTEVVRQTMMELGI